MDVALWYGQIMQDTRVNGNLIRLVARANSSIPMETFTMALG